MKSNKMLFAYVHSSWNFCVALTYARRIGAERITIIIERDISITRYLRDDANDLEINIIYSDSLFKKFRTLFSINKLVRSCKVSSYIKFTNYSYFGQLLQLLIKFNKTIFLDDGSTFINILDDSLVYEGWLKKLLKKLLWPPGFEPRFDCFVGVDIAFLSMLPIIQGHVEQKQLDVRDFTEVFSYAALKNMVSIFLDVSCEIEVWEKSISKHDTLVLGSSFVEHGFMSHDEYSVLIRSLGEFDSPSVIYKPHPHEESTKYLDIGSWIRMNFSDLPLEIFLSFKLPKRIVSFGSTSSFLLIAEKADVNCEVFLGGPLSSERILNPLLIYNGDNVNISSFNEMKRKAY